MKKIVLYGAARAKFGGPFLLDVETPIEAFRFLMKMKPGFEQFLRGHAWKVIRGPRNGGLACDIDRLKTTLGKITEIHLVPVIGGAKRGGIGKIILGALIAVVAVVASPLGSAASVGAALGTGIGGTGITFGSVAIFGASLILSGFAQMLAATPAAGNPNDRETNKASFIFNGPVNVTQEGQPIPLVYGFNVRVGSVVGSAGLFSEDVTA
jgi:predicted phage tail protein